MTQADSTTDSNTEGQDPQDPAQAPEQEQTYADGYADLPAPEVRGSGPWWRVQFIWLVPLIALAIGLSLGVRSLLSSGPTIRISFDTAEGLSPGKTEVRYKEVVIGEVTTIELADDHNSVIVSVALNKSAANFAVDDTRFWVVKPHIGIGGISGLGTLLSGSYIGADIGTSNESRFDFKGLEIPPAVTHGMVGTRFLLHSNDLGSLDIGSPIYFHRIQVGRIVGYDLDDNGHGVTLQGFVDAPNDRYLTHDARFWNASGVDVSLGPQGLHVNTESLATVVAGGIAFQPGSPDDTSKAEEGAEFQLYPDVTKAMAPADGPSLAVHFVFDGAANGLDSGSGVEFTGILLGTVTQATLHYDDKTGHFFTDVDAVVYPERLKGLYPQIAKAGGLGHFLQPLIAHGFRAQLHRGNLLAGGKSVLLDFVKHPPSAHYDADAAPLTIPTAPDSLDQIQQQIGDIVTKLDSVPFDKIGNHLNDTLASANALLKQLDESVLPGAKDTLTSLHQTLDALTLTLGSNSPLMQNSSQTLEELQRTVRSFRELSDYLDRHPDALLRGKGSDPQLKAVAPEQAQP